MSRAVDVDDSEAGFTLTEVLAAMLILSVAVVAILAAMGSSLIMTNRVQQHASADSFARTYADRLQQTGYQPCATTTQAEYQPGRNAQNKGLALTIPSGLSAKPES